jgi:(2Fe-2S) ferredoxin
MPKPEKHVFVCTQSRPPGHPRGSCGEKGCRELWEAFMDEMEQRQLFDKIAITNTGCLGPCPTGANVLIYPEGIMYGKVTAADVAEIFESHLLGDTPVARLQLPPEVWG